MKEVAKIVLAMPNKCTGCAACASVCPTNSITMREDKEGFLQPCIDSNTCIGCHKCEKTCPIITPKLIPLDFETQAFAVINKDEAVRMRSSSGGVFYALAKWTIEQGGVVFGARFNENWEVVHDYTETIDGIEPFMRSKYVQSRIGYTFKQAKDFLEQGRQVLYTGTPCQIGGLITFLNKNYDNLLTVDLICHGVPSPKVWREYLKYIAHGEVVTEVNMRNKDKGWLHIQQLTTTTTTTTTTTRCEFNSANAYIIGFLDDIYLRRSCYDCHFKTIHHSADLTVGDYWGVNELCPKLFDGKGTSIVFVHSNKGNRIISQINDNLIIDHQTIENGIKCNPSMIYSMKIPRRRKSFFRFFNMSGFSVAKYFIYQDNLLIRILCKIKKRLSCLNRL